MQSYIQISVDLCDAFVYFLLYILQDIFVYCWTVCHLHLYVLRSSIRLLSFFIVFLGFSKEINRKEKQRKEKKSFIYYANIMHLFMYSFTLLVPPSCSSILTCPGIIPTPLYTNGFRFPHNEMCVQQYTYVFAIYLWLY